MSFQMYFRNFTADTFQEIKLPQCHGDCHLQTFLAFLQPFIPEDWERECGLKMADYQGNQTFSILLCKYIIFI
uniref:PDEase domain-containing protein n=1 Tax=Bursaphelenchus xylophilus TaxID=6326 RepID=A0A1I7SHP2_BURXY